MDESSEVPVFTFVSPTNLVAGAGNEWPIIYHVNNLHTLADINIIQTAFAKKQVLQQKTIDDVKNKAEIITIDIPINKFDFLTKRLPGRVVHHFFIEPLMCRLYRNRFTALKDVVEKSDVIYLFNNSYAHLICRNAKARIIGNMDSFFVWGILGRVVSKMTTAGLLFRRIYLFHLLHELPHWDAGRKSIIIPNGVRTDFFKPQRTVTPKVRFIFVSRLETRKGTHILIKAWHELINKHSEIADNAELHVAGAGSLENVVKTDPTIVYHGALEHRELSQLEGKCDIFIFPTEGETFGNVVLEALSSGLFVIAADTIRSIFEGMFPTEYVKYVSGQADAYRDAMYEAYKNVDRIRLNKVRVSNAVRSNFDWQSISNRLYDVFMGAIQDRNELTTLKH